MGKEVERRQQDRMRLILGIVVDFQARRRNGGEAESHQIDRWIDRYKVEDINRMG